MSLIKEDILLIGRLVRLEVLRKEHFNTLNVIGQDRRIWEFLSKDGLGRENIIEYLEEALVKKEKGVHYPFVIFDLATNKIIGTTRLWKIDVVNRKLEVGWTWLSPDYWGGNFNLETKFLLLRLCFETLKMIKVSFVASEENLRSRKAIEKLGASQEGILRKERIGVDGISRGFAYYSILNEEWDSKKELLVSKLS